MGGRLSATLETALYRAAQEAVRNVARRLQQKRAVIELHRGDREMTSRIDDDGGGVPSPTDGTPGLPEWFGLEVMRERLKSVHVKAVMSSRPSGGAEITIHVPLEVRRARTIAHRG